jgi:hypothetical protein
LTFLFAAEEGFIRVLVGFYPLTQVEMNAKASAECETRAHCSAKRPPCSNAHSYGGYRSAALDLDQFLTGIQRTTIAAKNGSQLLSLFVC